MYHSIDQQFYHDMKFQTPVGEKNVIKKLHVVKNQALISISKMDGKCAKTVMPRQ